MILVPQRLSRLQRVLNPLLRLLLAAERLKRLALQIKNVLLAHRRSGVTLPPQSTSATLVAIFTSWSLMYSPCRMSGRPASTSPECSPGAGMSVRGAEARIRADQLQRASLGVSQDALAVHGDVVDVMRNPRLRASCADVETFAIAIVSKAFFMASISSTDSPRPPDESLLRCRRRAAASLCTRRRRAAGRRRLRPVRYRVRHEADVPRRAA